MATGAKMSFNHYQNGKYGTVPQNPGKDIEITQDMHLKMSKKIAQLTKVIYALNTKNDEHEQIITNIKEYHEEQMQQLLNETKAKIEQFHQRLGTELDQQRRLEKLEVMVQDQERHKRGALAEFEAYRKERDQKETEMKTAHSQALLAMSQKVLTVKKEFQGRLEILDAMKQKIEKEKEAASEAQRLQHENEMRQLKESLLSTNALSVEQEKQHENYKLEIEKLAKICESLTAEKKLICEEYEGKLNKAQAFYEKELQVIRDSQNASANDDVQKLRDEQQKMVKDFGFEKAALTKRIDALISQVSEREEEVENYRKRLQQQESSLQNNNSNIAVLNKQVKDSKEQANEALAKLKEVQTELTVTSQRCDQQTKELVQKSSQLGELQVIRGQHEKQIHELQGHLSKLQDRVKLLESAKRALDSQSSQQTKQQVEEIHMLEKALEDLSSEKQKMVEKYEEELKRVQATAQEKERELLSEHQAVLEEVKQQHKSKTETLQRELEEKLKKIKEELSAQLDTEMGNVLNQKEAMERDSEQTRASLLDRLAQAEDKVARLSAVVEDSKQGLGSATSELNSLKAQVEKLKKDLEVSQGELRTTQNKAVKLQAQYDKLKELNKAKLEEAETTAKRKLDQLSHDLDTKWTDTLRKECERVTSQVALQKEEDKRASLVQLSKMKDAEIDSLRFTLTQKITELQKQVTGAQASLEEQQRSQMSEADRVRKKAEAENKRLMTEMLAAAEDYANKIESMETIYSGRLKHITHKNDQETKALEDEMKRRHIEDIQAQVLAHKATLASVQQQAEEKRKGDLQQQSNKHTQEIDNMRSDLRQAHSLEIETVSHDHQQQLAAARMELERSIELTRQKESEYNMKISDLQDDIKYREHSIRVFEEQVRELQQGVEHMTSELKSKAKQLLRIRNEATATLMAREEQLDGDHKIALTLLSEDYLREKQVMLAEFVEAQQLLKDKISALQLMLEDAEDRYQNRESRPEDLEMIQQLKETIRQREQTLTKLNDEKRRFQMELMNRETNFNKMFNANPQVGLLNPLGAKPRLQKKSEKSAGKFAGSSGSLNSVGSGSSRLQPLPNSPLHDERLNHTRPLPPMKKFVR